MIDLFLQKLIKLRDSGLTQKEIGKRFGVSQPTVSRWLAGKFGPHANAVLQILESN